MAQNRPSGSKRTSSLPASSRSTVLLTSREPKPRRDGGVTGGPPSSRHSILIQGSPPSSRENTRQVTWTEPVGTESAPYLAALVVSSWNAMPSTTASLGARWR
jgi:hypothetical protein